MLAEERFAAILSILQKQRTVTVLELTQALSISESTIRRDLVALHKMGKLKKVHGGATLLHKEYGLYETEVAARSEEHVEEKKRIARYAASLIQAHDFVYIDAGSTTLHMVEYLKEEEAIYVTNGLEHGRRLAAQGFRTFLLAGCGKQNRSGGMSRCCFLPAEIQFQQGIFRNQRYNGGQRLYHTGYQ